MSGLHWFPCNPEKLLGALACMKPTVGYTYTIMLLRIYECGGACPDTLDAIATRTRFNKRIVSNALKELFAAGRLVREADGIHNPKANEIIAKQEGVRERHQTAGRNGGLAKAKKTKTNQSQGPSQATLPLEPGSSILELELEKESKKDSGARRAPAASLSEGALRDERTQLFQDGLARLQSMTKMSRDAAAALIGRWLRDSNDDVIAVIGAIEEAERNMVIDARSYIAKILQTKNANIGGKNGKENGSASAAGRRLAEQLRSGELSLAGRPSSPGVLRGSGDAPLGLLSPRPSE